MRSYMQEEIVSKENSNNIGKSKETLMRKMYGNKKDQLKYQAMVICNSGKY